VQIRTVTVTATVTWSGDKILAWLAVASRQAATRWRVPAGAVPAKRCAGLRRADPHRALARGGFQAALVSANLGKTPPTDYVAEI
jgi:hypothetical protein